MRAVEAMASAQPSHRWPGFSNPESPTPQNSSPSAAAPQVRSLDRLRRSFASLMRQSAQPVKKSRASHVFCPHGTILQHFLKTELWNPTCSLCGRFARRGCDGVTTNCPTCAVRSAPGTRGWRSSDSCSRTLCGQTGHPSCCAGFDRTARDH